MNVSWTRGGTVVVLAAILVLLVTAGCAQPQASTADVTESGEDTAEAVLRAYREYAGEVEEVKTGAPAITATVTNVAGSVAAYDLTQGDPPCVGFIQRLPSLVFTVGDLAGDVQVAFAGDTETALLVVAEGEEIICDASAAVTLTPELTLQEPVAGRYGVWVGRIDMGKPINGVLTVSAVP